MFTKHSELTFHLHSIICSGVVYGRPLGSKELNAWWRHDDDAEALSKCDGRAPCALLVHPQNSRHLTTTTASFFQDATRSQQDSEIDELKIKFMKHRQILTANCEQAEDEVKRLDEIFHETVNQVLQVRHKQQWNVDGFNALLRFTLC